MVNQVKMAKNSAEETNMEVSKENKLVQETDLPPRRIFLSTTTSQSNLRRKRGPNEGLK
jgi:hypothetical protein